MKLEPVEKIEDLEIGDILRHKGGGDAIVVTGHYGDYVIAVRTTHVSNPSEWLVLKGRRDV